MRFVTIYILSASIILIGNQWIWEIFRFNYYLFILVLSSSVLLYLSIIWRKRIVIVFYLLLILILVIQWKTTNNILFGSTDIDDRHLFAIRRNELPKLSVSILNSNYILNTGRYMENELTYIAYKLEQNLFRSIDMNLYFFGGHPRERSGVREFEKFPFLFLPFFIFGLIRIIELRLWALILAFLVPILELVIIGQNNLLGPFSLFPFFSVTMAVGVFPIMKNLLITVKSKSVSIR